MAMHSKNRIFDYKLVILTVINRLVILIMNTNHD